MNRVAFVYLTVSFLTSISISLFMAVLVFVYAVGYQQGMQQPKEIVTVENVQYKYVPVEAGPSEPPQNPSTPTAITWGGPELWEMVNIKRKSYGVNALTQADEICTISSIRLNQLLELGKLDAHEGFSLLPEQRPDLKWIYEKYSLSEFLVSGVDTPEEAVDAWDNTLAHKKLLTGGEYVWGCIYAQNGFGVAIAAY